MVLKEINEHRKEIYRNLNQTNETPNKTSKPLRKSWRMSIKILLKLMTPGEIYGIFKVINATPWTNHLKKSMESLRKSTQCLRKSMKPSRIKQILKGINEILAELPENLDEINGILEKSMKSVWKPIKTYEIYENLYRKSLISCRNQANPCATHEILHELNETLKKSSTSLRDSMQPLRNLWNPYRNQWISWRKHHPQEIKQILEPINELLNRIN